MHAENAKTIYSPDKHTAFTLSIKDQQLNYAVVFNGNSVIADSQMGLPIDNNQIGDINDINLLSQKIINQTYDWRGVHSIAKIIAMMR